MSASRDKSYVVDARRGVYLLSGGIDSALMAELGRRNSWRMDAIHVTYGQVPWRAEWDAAKMIASHYGMPLHRVDLRVPYWESNPLLDGAPPGVETLAELRARVGDSPYSIPGRNAVLLSLAAGLAQRLGFPHVFIGCGLSDAIAFPDCREDFLAAMSGPLGVDVRAPLATMDKDSIVGTCVDLGVPLEMTTTCYHADEHAKACGRCEACILRIEAYERLELTDPRLQ